MTEVMISAERLGKRYDISERVPYGTIRTTISRATLQSLGSLAALIGVSPREEVLQLSESARHVWALRDVSFQVRRGEVLGIIGPNGAGKSTLLKILSRITEPTTGRARVRGRVGALLEVGVGFHPELTGRENIYLNGAILGMSRGTINRLFDSIVDFAELETFIETPVKWYSSGMKMRLGFAVAAHFEPDILLVDEVLAVGDAAFQRKCLGRLDLVAQDGRTVLFVSHNLAAIQALCGRALLIAAGGIVAEGQSSEIVRDYLKSVVAHRPSSLAQRVDRTGDGSIRATSIRIINADDHDVIRSGSRLLVTLEYRAQTWERHVRFQIWINDDLDNEAFLLDSDLGGEIPEALPPIGSVSCVTGPINVTSGRLVAHVEIQKQDKVVDFVRHAAEFEVEPEDFCGRGKLQTREDVLHLVRQRWQVERGADESPANCL